MNVIYHCHKVTFLHLAGLAPVLALGWSVLLEFAGGEMLLRGRPELRSSDQRTERRLELGQTLTNTFLHHFIITIVRKEKIHVR